MRIAGLVSLIDPFLRFINRLLTKIPALRIEAHPNISGRPKIFMKEYSKLHIIPLCAWTEIEKVQIVERAEEQ